MCVKFKDTISSEGESCKWNDVQIGFNDRDNDRETCNAPHIRSDHKRITYNASKQSVPALINIHKIALI